MDACLDKKLISDICLLFQRVAHFSIKFGSDQGQQNLLHAGKRLVVIDKFNYLDSYITPGGRKSSEIPSHILSAPLSFTKLRHMRHQCDTELLIKSSVYTTVAIPLRNRAVEDRFWCLNTVVITMLIKYGKAVSQ